MPICHTTYKILAASTLCMLASGSFAAVEAAEGAVTLDNHIKPVLQQFCFDCHNAEKTKGDINLVDVAKNPKLIEKRAVWNKVIETLENGDMPPEKKPKPSEAQRGLVLHFL